MDTTVVDQDWDEYDPYGEHELGSDLCPGCFYPNTFCHKCGGTIHNIMFEQGNEMLLDHMCDSCGYRYTTGMEI